MTATVDLEREIADIRDGLRELQDRFELAMRDVRELPGGELVWERIDAYPGTRLDRDMGAGQDADGWLAEVAEFLEDLDHGCGGFAGGDAWGPCTDCGRRLADHD